MDGLALLRRLVDIPSGSGDGDGIARCVEVLRPELGALGFEVEVRQAGGVPHLVAHYPGPAPEGPRAILVSHLDTVIADPSWQLTVDGEQCHGPGVADPYGGVVVLVRALQQMDRLGSLGSAAWTVILNGDEETGSTASAAILEELAVGASAGFVFESARSTGALVCSRAGSSVWRVELSGRAAHAGVNPQDGASAVLGLSHLVLALEKLSDYERGLSVNVGRVDGGLKRNQVPDRAHAEIDIRYREASLGERVDADLLKACEAVASQVPGVCAAPVKTGGRPAWNGGEETDRLLAHWREAALELGLEPPAAVSTGGGSDANILASCGLPCLDGLGAIGGGYHTRSEWVDVASLEERIQLTATALSRWLQFAHRG